jgi:hypothetical protein
LHRPDRLATTAASPGPGESAGTSVARAACRSDRPRRQGPRLPTAETLPLRAIARAHQSAPAGEGANPEVVEPQDLLDDPTPRRRRHEANLTRLTAVPRRNAPDAWEGRGPPRPRPIASACSSATAVGRRDVALGRHGNRELGDPGPSKALVRRRGYARLLMGECDSQRRVNRGRETARALSQKARLATWWAPRSPPASSPTRPFR